MIYIVDNSPTDDLKEYICSLSSKVMYFFGQGNIGYGSAHNIAIRESIKIGAKYHVVLNPDIVFETGTIEELSEYMDNNSDVGQVMPKVIYPNGELQYLCKLYPNPMDLFARRFIPIKSYVERKNHRLEMRDSGYDKIMQVPFLSGCFMFLRVDVLAMLNGFDDNFFMYCEDLDLSRSIATEGYKNIYFPNVTIIHAHKKESYKNKRLLKIHIKSAIYYFNKWGWFFDRKRTEFNKKVMKNIQTL